ncbi:hypothetical protein F66182_277 [Fusarium sp. NRRL 66182]|nr:hypothetical protein F66182_277 [Fusarium sp. NRRL 66182]
MTYHGNHDNYQQHGQPQGGHGQQQPGYGQGGYDQGGDRHGPGGYGHQQGGYQPDRPGLSDSYYRESHQYPPSGPQGYGQHQQGPQGQFDNADGPDGERGVMGALAGGAAGAFGGHKIGGKTGHSKTSTVVGALAGAFSGHKLQDAVEDWKDDRDEKKEEEKRKEDHNSHHHHHRRDSDSSQGSDRPRRGRYAGNFTASSRDIRLDSHGDYLLHASCKREEGGYQHSSISLDKLLENDNGSFRWSAGGHHGGSSTVTVQQGDTLRGIAARFDCSFDEIARHNNISNPDLIYPGQTLQVPGGGRHGGGGFASSARNVRLVDGGQRLEGELSRDGDWVLSSIVLDERIKNFNGTLELI